MKIINSLRSIEYCKKGLPESPLRISKSVELLASEGYTFIEPRIAEVSEVLAAHNPVFVSDLKNGIFLNDEGETPNLDRIYDYSLLSAGGALTALDIALNGENSFSLMRPPGHHAGIKVMGFCYLNNAAIATMKAKALGVERVAVLDIDYHHGNGTQEILLCRPGIMHVDIHEENGWPNTGNSNSLNCLNFLVSKKCTEQNYLETLDDALNVISIFDLNLLIVSAGFDTYRKDPVGGLEGLNLTSYFEIGKKINNFAKESDIRVCSILEGGYNTDTLPFCISNYLSGFK
jgi:acetoin utilization deacetylase AcuC-like enzyme